MILKKFVCLIMFMTLLTLSLVFARTQNRTMILTVYEVFPLTGSV